MMDHKISYAVLGIAFSLVNCEMSSAADISLTNTNDDLNGSALGTRPMISKPLHCLDSGLGNTCAIADVDKDGATDIINTQNGHTNIWLSKGDGNFRLGDHLRIGLGRNIVLNDINADGRLDLVGISDDPNLESPITVLFGKGNGSFSKPIQSVSLGAGELETTGDLDGDGNIDAVIRHTSRYEFSVLLGNGDGTFQEPSVHFNAKAPQDTSSCRGGCSIELGDFNNDGMVDALAADMYGIGVSVMLGNGDGSFEFQERTRVGIYVKQAKVDDLNGDGLLDAAVLFSHGVKIMLNQGDGTLQEHHTIQTDIADKLSLGDLDDNGHPDALISGRFAEFVSVSLSKGDGSFQRAQNIITDERTHQGLGDFNADGALDLLLSDSTVIMGNGDGSF
jgi:hypothetical protein